MIKMQINKINYIKLVMNVEYCLQDFNSTCFSAPFANRISSIYSFYGRFLYTRVQMRINVFS